MKGECGLARRQLQFARGGAKGAEKGNSEGQVPSPAATALDSGLRRNDSYGKGAKGEEKSNSEGQVPSPAATALDSGLRRNDCKGNGNSNGAGFRPAPE
jgi:hypothetical protein